MAEGSGKKRSFELIIGAKDKFSAVFSRFDKALAHSGNNSKKIINGYSSLQKFGQSMFGLQMLTKVTQKAAGGIFNLAKSTADAGDAAVKSAQRAGVGVKVWQEYAYAASLADLSQEQLIKGFGGLQDAANKAARGDKAKAGVFKLLGIDPKNAAGEVKNAESLFMELSDKIKALRDSGREAEAVNLLGDVMGDREARAFLPMLAGGQEGLRKMRQEAHKLGLVFSEEDGAASEAFNDSLTKGMGALKGLGYTFGRVLLPPLTKLIEKFTAWAAAQREMIGGGFAEWVESWDLEAIWSGFERLVSVVSWFASKVSWVVDLIGPWTSLMLTLSLVFKSTIVRILQLSRGILGLAFNLGGKLLPYLPALGSGFLKLSAVMFGSALKAIRAVAAGWMNLGAAFGVNPIIMAAAGIAIAVYAIYKNWDGIVSYFQNLWQGVKDAFSRNWVEGILKFLWDFNPLRLILKGMNELLNYFTGFDLFGLLKSKFGGIASAFPSWAKRILGIEDTPEGEAAGYGGASGAPLNMGPAARSLAESRSERVERNQVEIRVRTDSGAEAEVSGSGGSGVSWQTGELAWGY